MKGAGVNHVEGRGRVGVLAGTKHELNQASDGVSKFHFAVGPNEVPLKTLFVAAASDYTLHQLLYSYRV